MNAWYFTFEFPPDFGGGLSTYMRCVRDAYVNRPDQFLVVFALSMSQSGLYSRRSIAKNIVVITINPMRSKDREQLGHWVAVTRLFERFADLLMSEIESGRSDLPRPDYLEFADGFGIGALTIQQKLCRNSRFDDIPIIVLAHTPTRFIDRLDGKPTFQLPRYWIGELELQALIGADAVISPSQALLNELADELGRRGSAISRTMVLPNPYSPDAGGLPGAGRAPADEPDHFFMASRLAHWKGAEFAIRALRLLWRDGLDVPLRIYGQDTAHGASNASYKEYLTRKFRTEVDAGLVQFMGLVARDEIDRETASAFAQIHPSRFDNFPYSLLEAMHAGTICVAGRRGGIGEIARDGHEIFLTDVEDADDFARTLRRVMDLSPADRARIAKDAAAIVAERCAPRQYFAAKEAYIAEVRRNGTGRSEFPFLSKPTVKTLAIARVDAGAPKLSVVIPYFNMGAYIDETIESVSAATMPDWEIVLVNDGSDDPASVERLGRLHIDHGIKAERLRILTIPNGGVANARNTGAQAARAPVITLLDADDLVAPRYYERAMDVLECYDNVAFVGCWIEDFDEDGRIRNWATWNAEPPIQLIVNQTNCQSLVYRRDVFLRDGLHDPDLNMFLDDWEGVIALLAAGHRGVMIPEPLFRYRIRGNSIFRTNTALWDINFEKITRKHSDIYDQWGAEVAAFLNANGPNHLYHVLGKPSPLKV